MREDIFRRISDAIDADGALTGIDEGLREELDREPEAAAYARDLQTISHGLRNFRVVDLDDKSKARALATKTELKMRGRLNLEDIGDPTAPPRFTDDTVDDGFFSSIPTSEIDMTEYESLPPPAPRLDVRSAPPALKSTLVGFQTPNDLLESARAARNARPDSNPPTEELDLHSLPPSAVITPSAPALPSAPATDSGRPSGSARATTSSQPALTPSGRAIPKPPPSDRTGPHPRVDADGRIIGGAPPPARSIGDRISFPMVPGAPISMTPSSSPPPSNRRYVVVAALAAAALFGLGVFVGGSRYLGLSDGEDPVAEAEAELEEAMAAVPAGAVALASVGDPAVAEAADAPETVSTDSEQEIAETPAADADEPDSEATDTESETEGAAEAPASRPVARAEHHANRRERRAHDERPTRHADPAAPEARRAPRVQPRRDLPEAPERGAVLNAIRRVEPAVRACAQDTHGEARVRITIGGSGRVRNALVSGTFAGTPVGSCVARTVRTRARFPAFRQDSLTVVYPFSI